MTTTLMYPSKDAQSSNGQKFNPARLTFARIRRGLKKTKLAEKIGVTARSITGYESGEFPPDEENLAKLAIELKFPPAFFFEDEALEPLDADAVSFRALSKMSSGLKNIALTSGAIAIQLHEWIVARFVLPESNLPDFGKHMDPEAAAEALRHYWKIGESPIKNMVHLLEVNGVRVFSLAIDAKEVDAFSLWFDGIPFVFLNTNKTAEHSRFDAAHELGHLIMHKHGQPSGQDAERMADVFASAFLMPAKSITSSRLMFPTIEALVRAKKQWGVSVAALNYRLHHLKLTTDWTYRTLCIQISKLGMRTSEPNSMQRESSQVFEKVFSALRSEKLGKHDIAKDLNVSIQEIDELTYGLLKIGVVPDRATDATPNSLVLIKSRPSLSVVR